MVKILDSTLREGAQTPGVTIRDKQAIVDMLDRVGVDYIEAGHPVVSDSVYADVNMLANMNLKAVVGAHARSLRKDVDKALECGVGFLGIFYCVSESRLNGVFRKDLSSAISQIEDTIVYARGENPGLVIRYTPEDTVRSEFSNVLEASVAAVRAGADIISVADTTGYMVPGTDRSMYDFVRRLRDGLSDKGCYPEIAVHCHNDRGLALANAIDSYRAGADIIDASVLGLGERAGIVDLASLLCVLSDDFHQDNWNLEHLPGLYDAVSRYTGVHIPINAPYVGENAFTHCSGVHVHAVRNDPLHYQSVDPGLVGRSSDIVIGPMSGLRAVQWALDKAGYPSDKDSALQVLDYVKSENKAGNGSRTFTHGDIGSLVSLAVPESAVREYQHCCSCYDLLEDPA